MKSSAWVLVGVLVVIAMIAVLKHKFFGMPEYDLQTQGNALRFGYEGYEDPSEATEHEAEAEHEETEHMTNAAKAKRADAKAGASLRVAVKKAKELKKIANTEIKNEETKDPKTTEKFENTPRFVELKEKWDAYKAGTGPALLDAERSELLTLLDQPADHPAEEAHAPESFEQFEEMPYQGTEYAMF